LKRITRRIALAGLASGTAAVAGAASAANGSSAIAASRRTGQRLYPAQTGWTTPPPIEPAREGPVSIPGTTLWHQDMGGSGVPVVLLHANTGCYASWPYQQSALAAAGLRAIAYSARGFHRSGAIDPADPGTSTGDLAALLDRLEILQAHIVGTAAGGLAALDYSLSRPQPGLSLPGSSSHMSILDSQIAGVSRGMAPHGVYATWRTFSELGPSYRAANPAGVAAWEAIAKVARQDAAVRQKTETPNSFARIAGLSVPALFITGDADPIMPPARMREVASRAPGSEIAAIAEAGHSPAWEQPEAFNAAVLEFIGRQSRPSNP